MIPIPVMIIISVKLKLPMVVEWNISESCNILDVPIAVNPQQIIGTTVWIVTPEILVTNGDHQTPGCQDIQREEYSSAGEIFLLYQGFFSGRIGKMDFILINISHSE
jgi:hypothetical protein